MTFCHFIGKNIDNNIQRDVLYTDLSKTFDRVNHCILIPKLKEFCLDEKLIINDRFVVDDEN